MNDRKQKRQHEHLHGQESKSLRKSDDIRKSFHHNDEETNHEENLKPSRYPITSAFGNCPNVSLRYKKQCRIGEGTYGVVYKALDLVTKEVVALKRCLPHHEASDGFPITTLREIQILKEIQGHENIVRLKEVAVSSRQSGVFLVFEFSHFDLANLVDEYYDKHGKGPFTVPETKCLALQLLCAIKYLHDRCIIHRDLKLSNILYDKDKGLLKLCDFGLARQISKRFKIGHSNETRINLSSKLIPTTPPTEYLTPKVVSLWYRPPELLLNSEYYDFAIDSWGTGCIIAELLLGIPLFKGKSEMNQLQAITKLLGKPTIESWPGLKDMPLFKDGSCELIFNKSGNKGRSKFLDTFSNLSTAGILLLSDLLKYDPETRLKICDAHKSDWFQEYPKPVQRLDMPTFPWKK